MKITLCGLSPWSEKGPREGFLMSAARATYLRAMLDMGISVDTKPVAYHNVTITKGAASIEATTAEGDAPVDAKGVLIEFE